MEIRFRAKFIKQYNKLPSKTQKQFDERLRLFIDDPAAPQLRIHPLNGNYAGYWSMNVSGDLRAVYQFKGDEVIIFLLIGTHSQLYG